MKRIKKFKLFILYFYSFNGRVLLNGLNNIFKLKNYFYMLVNRTKNLFNIF